MPEITVPEIIDTNVSLSRWPTRRLPLDETPKLVERLRSLGVVEAWAASFDGLLHKDLTAANGRLAQDCAINGDGLLLPFGCLHPLLPAWRDDLRRCKETHGMRGIRLFPNYHGYLVGDPSLVELLELAAENELLVQIAVRLEDPRTQSRLLAVADVDLAPLVKIVSRIDKLQVVILGGLNCLPLDVIDALAATGRVSFDIAALEGLGGLERLLLNVPLERIVFGSHAPFFAAESAVLKLQEASLGEALAAAIRFGNARRHLPVER